MQAACLQGPGSGAGQSDGEAHPTVPRALVAGLGRWPVCPKLPEPGLLVQQADEPLPRMGAPVTVILVTIILRANSGPAHLTH